ncbi:hypothetical protein MACH26_31240 [Planctobacterium marinum]|uniref:Uncharacterized protein n=1 Tax=Planctobacterium marinum TaxID=1631968 RepID=A0AA48HXC0_9ALTE|nr:hypothetical protein MACH26_31240 [Planctobacterium marinum]
MWDNVNPVTRKSAVRAADVKLKPDESAVIVLVVSVLLPVAAEEGIEIGTVNEQELSGERVPPENVSAPVPERDEPEPQISA